MKANLAYGPKKTGDPKCILWFLPYRNLAWPGTKNLKNDKLVNDMLKATPRPLSVTKLANEFIIKFLKDKKFVGIHWRFDENYEFHCKVSAGIGNKKACSHILGHGFDLKDISKRMLDKFKIWQGKGWVEDRVDKVFIAAPPNSNITVKGLAKNLEGSGIEVFWSENLMEFIKEKFKNCDKSKFFEQIHDFVSQVEQEICYQSQFFVMSWGSSWSDAVVIERRARKTKHTGIVNFDEFF